MIIIYKQDGSIFSKSDSDYVQQGSNNVNKIFVAFVGSANQNWSANARFVRANDTETNKVGIPTTFAYNGINYSGWVFNLSSAETYYAGNLRVFISFYDAGGSIKNTYITNIIVNATGYPIDEDVSTPITTAEFNSYMAQIAAKQPLQGMTSVVVETLPTSGVVGVLYFLKGSLTDKVYSQYIWNGSAFVWVGSLVLDTFATLEEQRAFEEELQDEWEEYRDNLTGANQQFQANVNMQISQIRELAESSIGGSPKGVYDSVQALTSAFPTGNDNVYLVGTNWYYWNGSAWTNGGQYLSSDGAVGYKAIDSYATQTLTLADAFPGVVGDTFIVEKQVYAIKYLRTNNTPGTLYIRLSGLIASSGYLNIKVYTADYYKWAILGAKPSSTNLNAFMQEVESALVYYMDAEKVPFDNMQSGLDATNVQGAIDDMLSSNLLTKKDLFELSGTTTYVNSSTGIDIPVSRLQKKFTKFIIKGEVTTTNGTLLFGGGWYSNPNRSGHVSNLVNAPYQSITNTSGKIIIYKDFDIPAGANYLNLSPYLYGTDGVEKTATINDIVIIDDNADDEMIVINRKITLDKGTVSSEQTKFIEKTVIYDGAVDLTSIEVGSYKIIATANVKDTDIISCMLEDERTLGLNIGASCYDANGSFLGSATRYYRNQAGYWMLLPNTAKIEVLAAKNAERHNVKRVLVYKNSYGNELLENIQPSDNYFNTIHLPKLYIKGCIGSMSKDNEVEGLEYEYGSLTGTCSMKWQGSSSLNYPKKNFTIKFDNAFEAKEGWGNQRKYCLKANWVDMTQAKNVVNSQTWGAIVKSRTDLDNVGLTKLKNSPNGGAVDGFPIVLFINDMCFGLYTFNIPKDAWMMGMGEGTQEAIVSNENYTWETLNPTFGDNANLEIEYATDESDIGWITTDINAIITAIQNNDSTTLNNLIDFQSFIDYWIFSNVICNTDAQRRNWLFSKYDNSKWFATGYDMDLTYGAYFSEYRPINYPRGLMDNALFNKIVRLAGKEAVIQRFNELTHPVNGLLGINKLWERFNEFWKTIPQQAIEKDLDIWNSLYARSSDDTIGRIYITHKTRLELMPQWIDEFFD